MATKKRMGGMRLSDFGGQPTSAQVEPVELPAIAPAPVFVAEEPVAEEKPDQPTKTAKRKPPKKEEKFVTVNIKILESQQEWLADTAKLVRQNNDSPVPASDRVYPQHLIQTAIDFLKSADVNWQEIKNVEDLKQILNL